MSRFSLLILSIVLSSCARLPERSLATNDSRPQLSMATWLNPGLQDNSTIKLVLCDIQARGQACKEAREGLNATGLGGIFLPLKVLVPSLTLTGNRADPQVIINGVNAACASGSMTVSANHSSLEITNILCNWLLIGNVVSSVKLTLDWDDPDSRRFGGRYLIKFFGTGNGSGSGFYSAEVQS